MKLTFKAKRNIGLVVLTVAVIAVIILTIALVQKNDDKDKIVKGGVGQIISADKIDLQVVSLKNSLKEFNGVSASDGKYFMLAKVSVKAKKKIAIEHSGFTLSDGKEIEIQAEGYDFLTEAVTLKKGEEKVFYLLYEVQAERMASFYLDGYNCRVDMGGSVNNSGLEY
ncbi:MAG: hypothetical protein K2K24_03330 [Clostridia bacterium]|nr:hypothetical protein [Clostridia bacterium]